MASIPYLVGGEKVGSAQLNLIWAEFDRKLTLLLGGKSFLLNQPTGFFAGQVAMESSRLFGQPFYFGTPNTLGVYFGTVGTTYNHSTFTAAAAALVASSYDDSLFIANATTSTTVLDGSLQAHYTLRNGVPYFWRGPSGRPERKHKLAVAEIISQGQTALVIPETYDKFSCFRVHNMHNATLNVAFGATILSVPPFGCKTIRRIVGTSTYEVGWNYFWKFRTDDLRLFSCKPTEPVLISMRANNVANPTGIFDWCEAMTDRYKGSYFIADPSASVCPMKLSRYGDATQPTTQLGDLIHHGGKFYVVNVDTANKNSVTIQSGTSRGQSTIAADFGSFGFTVTVSGSSITFQQTSPTIQTDLIFESCNLLKQGETQRLALNINTARTVETSVKLTPIYTRQARTASVVTRFYERDGLPDIPVSITNYSLADQTMPTRTLNIGETAGSITNLDTGSGDPNTSVCVFTNRRVQFTPFGPALFFTQIVTPDNATSPTIYSDDRFVPVGSTLQRNHCWIFSGHGFPFVNMFGETNAANQGKDIFYWLTADDIRITSALNRSQADGITNDAAGASGADFGLRGFIGNETTISIQQSLDATWIQAGRFSSFPSADALNLFTGNTATYYANRNELLNPSGLNAVDVRIPLGAIHYNTLAWMVNILTRGRPLMFQDVTFSEGGVFVKLSQCSLLGDIQTAAPVGAFAFLTNPLAGDTTDGAWSVARRLGLLKDRTQIIVTDPVSNQLKPITQLDQSGYVRTVGLNFSVDMVNLSRVAFFIENFDNTWSFKGSSDLGSVASGVAGIANQFPPGTAWISADEMKTLADSLGFNFCFASLGAAGTVKRLSVCPYGNVVARSYSWTNATDHLYQIFAFDQTDELYGTWINDPNNPLPNRTVNKALNVTFPESNEITAALALDDVQFIDANKTVRWKGGKPRAALGRIYPFQTANTYPNGSRQEFFFQSGSLDWSKLPDRYSVGGLMSEIVTEYFSGQESANSQRRGFHVEQNLASYVVATSGVTFTPRVLMLGRQRFTFNESAYDGGELAPGYGFPAGTTNQRTAYLDAGRTTSEPLIANSEPSSYSVTLGTGLNFIQGATNADLDGYWQGYMLASTIISI